MANRIKNLLLFLWRMLYPLILYHFIVSAVMFLVFIIIVGCGMSGLTTISDSLFNELNNQLSLLLTGLGAILASIPLGILYVLFCCQQETARQQAEELRSARLREEELWVSGLPQYEFQEAGQWTCDSRSGGQQDLHSGDELCSGALNRPSSLLYPDRKQPLPASPVHLHMNLREIRRIIALGFSLCICVNALLLTLPFSWDSFEEVGDLLYTPSLFHQILCVGLIVPFAEELVFRGLGYAKMRLMLPVKPAVIISALYFGIYHGNLLQGIYATVLGLALAWIMESYGALSAAYVLHASANIMSIMLSNTIIGVFLYVFTLRCGLILICGGAALFILYKIREDRLDYETSVDCNSML